jgi:molybdopterin molybdotransferase
MTVAPTLAAPGCGCERVNPKGTLLAIDEAIDRILAHACPPAGDETVDLARALGRVLARPVRSAAPVPPFDNAAMDGFALRCADLTGPGPWRVPVVSRVPAGHGAGAVLPGGAAVRIFTGAPLPAGADAVVMQEEVTREGDAILLGARPHPGLNLRRASRDLAAGDLALQAGRRLGPKEIAACAAAGAGRVHVRPPLRVALLVTGDEIRPAGGRRSHAQIWDVNTPMLSALMRRPAIDLISAGRAADDRTGLTAQLAGLAARCDLIVTTGGISVGEEDHVRPALAGLGARVFFSGVAIKPGKPVSFGRLGTCLWLGLPGNPLSAFVTFQVFGAALLRQMTGESGPADLRRHVVLSEPVHRKPGRCELRPASLAGFDGLGREVVRMDATTHSDRVGLLPAADGLAFLPAEAEHLPAGALVEFLPFCTA